MGKNLAEVIAEDPDAALGPHARELQNGQLPYLFKILAISKPLSLQVHPSRAQAVEGFARDNKAGFSLQGPHRVYRDTNHKPELVVAITPMTLLAGLRPAAEVAADVESVRAQCVSSAAIADCDALSAALESEGGLREYMRLALTGLQAPRDITDAVSAAATEQGSSLEAARVAASHFPGDGGVMVALAMNRVDLAPGQACFTPSQEVHSYVSGVGMEVMANSDNVIRAGLTPKHIDVEHLLEIAHTDARPPQRIEAHREGSVVRYPVPSHEFSLSVVSRSSLDVEAGPRIVFAHEGSVTISTDGMSLSLDEGMAAFVPYSDGSVRVVAQGATVVVSVPPQ